MCLGTCSLVILEKIGQVFNLCGIHETAHIFPPKSEKRSGLNCRLKTTAHLKLNPNDQAKATFLYLQQTQNGYIFIYTLQ